MNQSLNKIATFLDKLALDAKAYDESNTIPKLSEHALFEQNLFKSQSRQLIDYVTESKALLNQVKDMVGKNAANSIVSFQCDKLVDQCQAIKKALGSQQQRKDSYQIDKKAKAVYFEKKRQSSDSNLEWLAKKVMVNSQQLYHELSKHHEYRQRFDQRIDQLSNQLTQLESQDKIVKQQEILQLQKRLGQCNKAIYFIEQKIENFEKGKRRY